MYVTFSENYHKLRIILFVFGTEGFEFDISISMVRKIIDSDNR